MAIGDIRDNQFEEKHEQDYKNLAVIREQLKGEDLPLEVFRQLKTQEQDLVELLNPKQPR